MIYLCWKADEYGSVIVGMPVSAGSPSLAAQLYANNWGGDSDHFEVVVIDPVGLRWTVPVSMEMVYHVGEAKLEAP